MTSSNSYSTFSSIRESSSNEPLLTHNDVHVALTSPSSSHGLNSIERWIAPGQYFEETHFLLRWPQKKELKDCELVVCIHGIGSLFLFWEPLADSLIERGKAVLYYDLLGRGFSKGSPNGKYGRNEHIHQLRSLLQFLNLTAGKHHFVGHSMGGCLATIYASMYPENVKSLVLMAPAGLMGYFPLQFSIDCCCCFHPLARSYLKNPENQESSWRHAYYEPSGAALNNLETMIGVLHKMYKMNEFSHDAFWKSAVEFPLSDIKFEIQKAGKQTDIQFFFLWGKNDPVIPISNLSLWVSIIQEQTKANHIKTKIFDSCSHSIMGEHRPEVLTCIGDFIDII